MGSLGGAWNCSRALAAVAAKLYGGERSQTCLVLARSFAVALARIRICRFVNPIVCGAKGKGIARFGAVLWCQIRTRTRLAHDGVMVFECTINHGWRLPSPLSA